MATVTFTTNSAMQPTYRGATVQTKVQSLVSTATWSNGDVYVLNNIKLPHRAIVTDVRVKGSVVDGTYLLEMGTVGSAGVIDLFGSRTFSATAVLALTSVTLNVPTTISVSDDAADRYQTFAVRVDGAATSGTTSVSLQFVVSYYCP
jgi:hypothetical protein